MHRYLLALAFSVLALTGCSVATETPSDFVHISSFSDVGLTDYDGNIVNLADFEGKPVIINSWATWCTFCKRELPDFAELQDVQVIAINRGEGKLRAQRFSEPWTDDILFLQDPQDIFYKQIGGISMPETLFIDAEGNLQLHKRGYMPLDEMQNHINEYLK